MLISKVSPYSQPIAMVVEEGSKSFIWNTNIKLLISPSGFHCGEIYSLQFGNFYAISGFHCGKFPILIGEWTMITVDYDNRSYL